MDLPRLAIHHAVEGDSLVFISVYKRSKMYSLYSTHTLNQEYKLNSRTAVFTMWVCLFSGKWARRQFFLGKAKIATAAQIY